ncbi:MAG: aldehyde ferredoxin oxidoreductase family protein [Clostridiales bacterium]|nr:aldehyde ferredoxin oxidoreductase family protein [Clostridiales bacterium]
MIGYGKFLRVNLTTRRFTIEEIPEEWPKLYGGGRGFGAKILYDEVPDNCDALGEANKVIFCTGVLAGTNIQAVHRWVVVTKSPLTEGYCRSVGGGTFAAYMRFAGYDCIIIEGESSAPVYLRISKEGCTFHEASHIWGTNTAEAQTLIAEESGGGKNLSTVAIGQAGENGVRFAGTFCGRRSASRGGSGAVLGAKKLKGVCISADRDLGHLYDGDKVSELAKEQAAMLSSNDEYLRFRESGTTGGMLSRNTMGVFPTKNYRYGYLEGWEAMSGEEFRKLRIGDEGCYVCGARCAKVHKVQQGMYQGAVSEGPEYESYWSFSGPVGATDIGASIMADMLCDDYGLDTISTGGSIGFAYELYEKGVITKEDTDGLALEYGNHEAMVELIHKIGRYEGFGRILAMGTKRMAEHFGHDSQDYAMQVKGMELAGYEPRGLKCTAYGYATSNIGGAHGAGALAFQEWGMPVPRLLDRFEDFGKEDVVIYNQDNSCINEVGVVCAFANSWGSWSAQLYGRMLAAATGIEAFADKGFRDKIGERIFNLERAFIIRQGMTGKDDTLPKRVQTEPLHTCGMPGEGQMIRHLPEVLKAYYACRGWDQEGIPTEEKMRDLDLDYVVADLEHALSRVIIHYSSAASPVHTVHKHLAAGETNLYEVLYEWENEDGSAEMPKTIDESTGYAAASIMILLNGRSVKSEALKTVTVLPGDEIRITPIVIGG